MLTLGIEEDEDFLLDAAKIIDVSSFVWFVPKLVSVKSDIQAIFVLLKSAQVARVAWPPSLLILDSILLLSSSDGTIFLFAIEGSLQNSDKVVLPFRPFT